MSDMWGHPRTSAWVALTAFLAAAPAMALTPVIPLCEFEPSRAELLDLYAEPTETSAGVSVHGVGNDFIEFMHRDQNNILTAYLQHCPTGQELLVVFPAEGEDDAMAKYDEMVIGDTPFTFEEIGTALAPMGAGVRVSRSTFGSCGCDLIYGTG